MRGARDAKLPRQKPKGQGGIERETWLRDPIPMYIPLRHGQLICSSGVPTGNGELTKSELVDRINNFGLWPIVLLWSAAIINGITLIYPQFLQVRNFNNIIINYAKCNK